MFSLELRKLIPAPPGLSTALTDASYLYASLKFEEIQKNDEQFFAAKQKYRDCTECKALLRLCDDIFKQKIRVLACIAELFKLLQQEGTSKLELQKEINDMRAENLIQSEQTGQNKKFKNLVGELKKKDKQIQELSSENQELNKNRIQTQRILSQMQMDIENKATIIKTLAKTIDNEKIKENCCNKCLEKDAEIAHKSESIRELTERCQILTSKFAENIKVLSEKSADSERLMTIKESLGLIPEINGRELRISIHKKICEIETDFIELIPNPDNFEIIKMKYLQLPYLLKPIFDLTKQYEKSLAEFNKILSS